MRRCCASRRTSSRRIPRINAGAWPIGYEELAPFYDEAEALLGVRTFTVEPNFRQIVAGLRAADAGWREQILMVGLAPDILHFPEEARRFDGFASVRGLKSDAEKCLLDRGARQVRISTIATGKAVRALLAAPARPRAGRGVECEDGTRYEGDAVMLAAGALHSPRLLQSVPGDERPGRALPAYRSVGRNYKFHVLTAMLALSHRPVTDVLSKTMLMTHDAFPHSTLQTLGGSLARADPAHAGARLRAARVGRALRAARGTACSCRPKTVRIPTTVIVAATGRPPRRRSTTIPRACRPPMQSTGARCARCARQLLRLGYLAVDARYPALRDCACLRHAGGGKRPDNSVVDADGRVHGLDNLYVVDGSVLPRSSRVNPALTIYACILQSITILILPLKGTFTPTAHGC